MRSDQSLVGPRAERQLPPVGHVEGNVSGSASILAIGYALPLFYLAWTLFRGLSALPNPWGHWPRMEGWALQ